MDISKLPRLSQTTTPGAPPAGDAAPGSPTAEAVPPAVAPASAQSVWCQQCHAPNAPGSQFCNSCGAPLRRGPVDYAPAADPGAGAEAWISIAVGVILLFMSPNIIRYLMSPAAFEASVSITDATGQPLAYTKSVFFWGDLSLTLFALVLIVEGLVIGFVRRPVPVLGAFVLTAVATAMNFFYVAGMMAGGYGFQIMSALAVAFGVYIALYQWRLWTFLRTRRA